MTTEEALADRIQEALHMSWRAQWAVRDLCAVVVSSGDDGFIRSVAAHLGTSHRQVRKYAELAALFPPGKRSEVDSPATHWKWHLRDKRQGSGAKEISPNNSS